MRRFSKFLTVTASAALLSGCAAQHQLHRVAVDYNEMVAETSDELTLLNIVRAAHRYPMHFTTVSSLRGNASFSTSASLSPSFPGTNITDAPGGKTSVNEGTDVSSSLSVSASSSPSFDVAVLNTENFQRGIMNPVPASLVDSYIAQGWRDDLIAALFIERITFYNSNKERIGVLDNDPGDEKGACFLNFIRKHQLVPTRESSDDTPLIAWSDLKANTSLSDITTLDGKNYDLSDDKTQVVRKGTSSLALRANHVGENDSDNVALQGRLAALSDSECTASLLPDGNTKGLFSGLKADDEKDIRVSALSGVSETNFADAVITFRSVQGVFYFLGEVARPRVTNGVPKFDYKLRDGSLIFHLRKGGGAVINTRFDGKRFGINESSDLNKDRSVQVIALLQQVLNLQKNAKDLPTTQTVNIVP